MSDVRQVEGNALPHRSTKLLNIGRIWVNEKAGDNQPAMSGRLDRDLGAEITLSPNDRILLFPNSKREGKRDADMRVAIEVDAEKADAIIAAQRSRRSSN